MEAESPETIVERIVRMVRKRIPRRFGLEPFRDVQVLTPMNRSELGSHALNARLQSVLNPSTGGVEVERFGRSSASATRCCRRRIIIKKKSSMATSVASPPSTRRREVVVDYDGKAVAYDFGELDEIALAYALTIHKSQGSEYPAVVMPLHTQHFMMLHRNLLYTGLTRGKKLVVLVGSRKALEMAVRRQETVRRCSRACANGSHRSRDRKGAVWT